MLHVRVIVPVGRTDEVLGVTESETVTNVVVLAGAARRPAGDLIQFDVAREAANPVLDRLRELGIAGTGSISIEQIDVSISSAADAAEAAAPGYDEDAVVWAELTERTADDARMSWAFLVFLALATQLAGIGVLLDQPILIVGAMVLGPEFGAVMAACFGIVRRDGPLVGRALRTLVIGFLAAMAVTAICALVSRALGWIDTGMITDRPLTDFIVQPDKWSFIVALLAGIAGVLSITAGKSSTLVGVFISVTTVPAAGNIAVAAALADWGEVGGSFEQLAVNLIGMAIAGTATLLTQQALWHRYGERLAPLRRSTPDGVRPARPSRPRG